MKLRHLLSLSALVLVLSGCPSTNPPPSAEAKAAAETPLIAPAGTPDPTIPDVPDPGMEELTPPADSAQYLERLNKFERAYATHDIDAYEYSPDFESKYQDKYPFFRSLDCNIDNGETTVWCTYETQPQEIGEKDLAKWIPYLSNRDVLDPTLRCTTVCLNAQGVLVGAVQPEMLEWRKQFCPVEPDHAFCRGQS